jgi:hypothetical protein
MRIVTNILETIAQDIGQQMKISYTFARFFKKQLQQLFQQFNDPDTGT